MIAITSNVKANIVMPIVSNHGCLLPGYRALCPMTNELAKIKLIIFCMILLLIFSLIYCNNLKKNSRVQVKIY